jgi:hypothetical protein
MVGRIQKQRPLNIIKRCRLEDGKMLKPEDFKEIDYEFYRALSKLGSVLVIRLPSGSNVIVTEISRNSSTVRVTETGEIILSEEGLKECEGTDYLFIPEGSNDKDD